MAVPGTAGMGSLAVGGMLAGSEPPTRLLHRGQRRLRASERPGAHVHACWLRRDLDLFSSRRVSALALLGRWLDAHRQLDKASDAHLLGVPELLEDDLLERRERALGVVLAQFGAVGDGGHELRLRKGQSVPPKSSPQVRVSA